MNVLRDLSAEKRLTKQAIINKKKECRDVTRRWSSRGGLQPSGIGSRISISWLEYTLAISVEKRQYQKCKIRKWQKLKSNLRPGIRLVC